MKEGKNRSNHNFFPSGFTSLYFERWATNSTVDRRERRGRLRDRYTSHLSPSLRERWESACLSLSLLSSIYSGVLSLTLKIQTGKIQVKKCTKDKVICNINLSLPSIFRNILSLSSLTISCVFISPSLLVSSGPGEGQAGESVRGNFSIQRSRSGLSAFQKRSFRETYKFSEVSEKKRSEKW